MSWPNSADYQFALQDPGDRFTDPALRAGRVVHGPDGKPVVGRGTFADVYRLRTDDGDWAVKCYTRELPHLYLYEQIDPYLREAQPAFAVPLEYQANGIHVLNGRYPVVKMRWVEGAPLDAFIAACLNDAAALDHLFEAWVGLAMELQEAKVAHGDLQHGNVLVRRGPAGEPRLTLIDYDSMVVPAVVGAPCPETGHAAYQHPQRARLARCRLDMDHFPLLLIAATLRGLAVAGRPLWERHHKPNALLFTEADLLSPPRSDLLRELWKLPDPLLHFLLVHLLLSLARPADQTPGLVDLLHAAPAVSAEDEARALALLRGEVPRSRAMPGGAVPKPTASQGGAPAPPEPGPQPEPPKKRGLFGGLGRLWRRGKP